MADLEAQDVAQQMERLDKLRITDHSVNLIRVMRIATAAARMEAFKLLHAAFCHHCGERHHECHCKDQVP